MNDRFRFRAWWKPNYRKPIMLYDVEKTYDFMRGEPESVCADCFGEVLEDEDYIVMQCTGLKDKNGKLIYEGDIVKFNFDTDEIKAVVSWDNKELIGFYLNTTDYFKDKYVTDYDFYKNDYEVIGNIYENKELLESEG